MKVKNLVIIYIMKVRKYKKKEKNHLINAKNQYLKNKIDL